MKKLSLFFLWVFVLGAVVGACGTDSALDVALVVPNVVQAEVQHSKTPPMPPGLQAAVKQARQEDASEAYAAVRDEVGRVALKNPAQRFATTVDVNGIVVTAEENPWTWSLRTTGWGCGGAERAVRESEPAVDGNRVTYERDEFEEWYLNGPMGFEQGFTWPHPPDCAGTKSIRMQVDGDLAARLNAAGDAVELIDAEGRTVLRYADLSVMDATGKTLSAWMTVGAGEWALHWDDAGATYPVVVDPVMTTQEAKLLSGDTGAGDQFGTSVALSEDGQWAIVGAPFDDARGTDAGAAYIMEFSNGSWTQTHKLTPSDGTSSDNFGYSVAISTNTVLVGAYGDDIVTMSGTNDNQGSAYVFVRNGATWTEQAKLTASDGAVGDYFGISVALLGDTMIVGAPVSASTNMSPGAAYVFARSGTAWIQQAKLTAGDGAAGDTFGNSVALSGDTALVGARYDDIGTNTNQGSAYVFVRNGTTWTQQVKLTTSDGAAYNYFGTSVALSGDTALVGADGDNFGIGSSQGSAYVFVRGGTTWTQEAKLTAIDGAAYDLFGLGVALSEDGSVGWVGAPFSDDPKEDAGAMYVFSLHRSLGLSCTSAAACTSGFCVDGVCCNSLCDGSCQSCVASTNSFGTNGFCGPAKEGLDPHDTCDDSRDMDPSSCGTTGVCSAFGSCAVYAYGESCGEPQCTDSNVAQENFCNGVGACVAVTHDCKTYACAAGVCKSGECTTNTDCAGSAYCDTTVSPSACAVKKNLGDTCSPETKECKSGFCVDGVCCDSPCLGTCQACSNALKGGSEPDGYCGPAKQGTLDANCQADPAKPCGYDGTCNEFGACTLPASGSKSQEKTLCVGGFYYTRQFCNGLGSFVPDPSSAEFCDNAFQCNKDTGACKTECTNTASDCVTGFQCAQSTKECIPIGQCRTVGDCADDEVCDETFRCVKRDATITPDVYDDACACSLPGQTSSSPAKPLLALGIVALWLRSRRRSIPNDATMI